MWLDFVALKLFCNKLGFLWPSCLLFATLRGLQEHDIPMFVKWDACTHPSEDSPTPANRAMSAWLG